MRRFERTPGLSARVSASRHHKAATTRRIAAAFFVVLAIDALLHGDPTGILMFLAVAGYLEYKARERQGLETSFRLGAEAEERVGDLLAAVEGWGWTVEHDVLKHRRRGNVDHVVHSPSTTFVIDTKRSWCRERDLDQAHRHAAWAARHYGAYREIVPVVCIQRSDKPAGEIDGVVIVGSTRLLGYLGSTHWPRSIDVFPDSAARWERDAEIEDLLGLSPLDRISGTGA